MFTSYHNKMLFKVMNHFQLTVNKFRQCSHWTGWWNGASQKVYRIGLLFTLGMLLLKQFLLRNSTAPLRCWKWNVPYRIGFETVRIKSEQFCRGRNCKGNLVLVNDLFKSKGSVANCITNRACVHTGNASEQSLHHNRSLIPVPTVLEQLLKWSKNLSGKVWT